MGQIGRFYLKEYRRSLILLTKVRAIAENYKKITSTLKVKPYRGAMFSDALGDVWDVIVISPLERQKEYMK